MKREDAQIYIIGHKPLDYGYWDNSLYTPVQVGNNADFCDLRDNSGDNISEWNPVYAEGTATYFLWKNCHPSQFKGQCQYRRRLEFPEDYDFSKVFEDHDLIVASPLMYRGQSLQADYSFCHCPADIDLAESIVKELYHEYSDRWDSVIKFGTYIFYANGFVMRAADYDRYCEWLFSIFSEFKKRKGWNTVSEAIKELDSEIENGVRRNFNGNGQAELPESIRYQRQVFGFLSERLLTLYILQNYDIRRIMCKGYSKFEGV